LITAEDIEKYKELVVQLRKIHEMGPTSFQLDQLCQDSSLALEELITALEEEDARLRRISHPIPRYFVSENDDDVVISPDPCPKCGNKMWVKQDGVECTSCEYLNGNEKALGVFVMKLPGDIDQECKVICDAINRFEGITTTESCC